LLLFCYVNFYILAPMSLAYPELAPKVRESAVLMAFNGEPPPLPILSVPSSPFFIKLLIIIFHLSYFVI
jgi:hypothetical protein